MTIQEEFNATPLTFCSQRINNNSKDKADHKGQRYPFKMGIELELENIRNYPDDNGIQYWTTHHDDSLRNGMEFVTAEPLSGPAVPAAVEKFFKTGMTYEGGPRTSTHIHINMGHDTVETLRSMMIITYCLEDALFQVLNANRKYCGYCMPLTEMSAQRLRNLLGVTHAVHLTQAMGGNNPEKYYGLNVNSMRKHGTVEFRYFPGKPSKDELMRWLDYATQIKAIGQSTKIVDYLAFNNAEQFAAWLIQMMPEWGPLLIASVGAQSIYSQLQDVLGLLPDNQPQRGEALVFVSDPLLKLVEKLEFQQPEQFDYFQQQVRALKILSLGDWQNIYHQAITLKKTKSKTASIQADVEDWAMPADVAPARGYRMAFGGNAGQLLRDAADPVPVPDPEAQARAQRERDEALADYMRRHQQQLDALRDQQARARAARPNPFAEPPAPPRPRAPRRNPF